jgi:hypothetical protein
MTPKNFLFFFLHMSMCAQKKLFARNLFEVTSSIEEDKLQFCTLFLSLTFLLANVSHFSQF